MLVMTASLKSTRSAWQSVSEIRLACPSQSKPDTQGFGDVMASAHFNGLAVALAWWTHNRLMALDERCATAFADVDVQLKHRHNLIPGLVETVRGYAGHELTVLTEVTRARANALSAASPDTRLEAETQVGQSIT